MNELELRRQLLDYARKLNLYGLCTGSAGNISVRCEGGLLITPSGVGYDELQTDDIVMLSLDGAILQGRLKPSSEWHFHCAILAERADIHAVVHTHSLHCTALACNRRDIPAFHYMVAVAGGDSIRCAPYATFGTRQLAENALTALRERYACLLANHGALATGNNLASAFALAVEVESLAAQYCQALAVGNPQILSKEDMRQVLEQFASYGQQDSH